MSIVRQVNAGKKAVPFCPALPINEGALVFEQNFNKDELPLHGLFLIQLSLPVGKVDLNEVSCDAAVPATVEAVDEGVLLGRTDVLASSGRDVRGVLLRRPRPGQALLRTYIRHDLFLFRAVPAISWDHQEWRSVAFGFTGAMRGRTLLFT
ncbi:hypothetical protein [Terriglobus sp.]|uniref:hypothetical protein n=1 Tax=Terriglobus sp. TaxID=1889013 RepID=UPI003B00ADE1